MSFDERFLDREAEIRPDIGPRAWYLEEARRLESELGFSTSNFTTVSQRFFEEIGVDGSHVDTRHFIDTVDASQQTGFRSPDQDLVEHFTRQLAPHLPALREHIQSLAGDNIIVRPSPLDELTHPELSFAGAYKGYMPLETMSRDEHLLWGTASMLAGRFTKYGSCYYDRHGLDTDREVGAIYMEPFFELGKDIPQFYGTAYIADNHIRNEYHIAPPPDQAQRDPRITVQRDGQIWHSDTDQQAENSIDFTGRLHGVLEGLQNHFRAPLDVEYIVDPRGDLYIVQLRKISARHLANWNGLPLINETGIEHRSAIINTIGVAEGQVIDLRSSTNGIKVEDLNKGIIVVNHEPSGNGVDSRTLFEVLRHHDINGLRIVIDHGDSRLRDHLQYALAEDPGTDFILQTTDPNLTRRLRHHDYARITSDGISATVEN
jgi:hypothetical protein